MAQWRKIIVSGSNAELSHLSMSGDIDLTGNITGSSTSTGSFGYLAVSGDTTIGGNLTFGDASTDFVSFAADITSDIIPNASDSYDLGSTGQRWNNLWMSGSLTANGGPHSILSATTIDVDAEGALTLDGGSITIGGDTDVAVDIDSTTLDIDASGAITIDSTSTILISGDGGATFSDDTEALVYDGSGNLDFDTVGLDIDSSGAITIDGTSTVSIDGADDMNFTITSGTNAEDLTIQQIGANDSSIIITAAGTGTDAISIDATAGSMVVAPTLIDGKTLTIGPSSATQMVFTPHNTAANEKISLINTAGDATDAIAVTATAGGVDINAGTVLALDGTGGIDIGKTADVAIDIDSSTLDIDASGAVTIDTSAGGVSVDAAAASNFTTAAGALTLNGAGGVNIAGNAAEIDITTSAALDLNSGAFTLNGSTVGIDGTGVLTMGASEMNIDADGGAIDIDATTTITVGGTNATAVSIGKSNTTVSIPGSLDVNGTLTTIDTTNLRVADRFIQMASGSTTGDGGIIVTTAANGSGSALFWDDSATRWGLTGDGETGDTQIAATPRQYAVSVSGSAVSPVGSNPSDFGASAATRIGMMHVNTATGDIFIFS